MGADLCAVPVLSGAVLCGAVFRKGTLTRRGYRLLSHGSESDVRSNGRRVSLLCPEAFCASVRALLRDLSALSGHEIERLARR